VHLRIFDRKNSRRRTDDQQASTRKRRLFRTFPANRLSDWSAPTVTHERYPQMHQNHALKSVLSVKRKPADAKEPRVPSAHTESC